MGRDIYEVLYAVVKWTAYLRQNISYENHVRTNRIGAKTTIMYPTRGTTDTA